MKKSTICRTTLPLRCVVAKIIIVVARRIILFGDALTRSVRFVVPEYFNVEAHQATP